jgi:hypothetical protein
MGNCGKLFPACGEMLTGVEAKPLKKVNKPYKIRREGSFLLMGLDNEQLCRVRFIWIN